MCAGQCFLHCPVLLSLCSVLLRLWLLQPGYVTAAEHAAVILTNIGTRAAVIRQVPGC